MKKRIEILKGVAIALTAVALTACDKGYNEPADDVQNIYFGVTDGIDDGAGSPNLEPSYMTTREFAGLGCVSLGELSHKWEFLKRDNADSEWEPMNPFDMQLIRENSGIPSLEIDDYNPEDYTYTEPMTETKLKNLLFYFDQPGEYNLRITNTFPKAIDYFWETFNYVFYLIDVQLRSSVPQSDGTHLIVEDFIIHAYKKLEGECKIYTDSAKSNEFEFDFRSETPLLQILEIKRGSTIYVDEISGDDPNFEFDYVDSREWKVVGGGALSDGTANGDGNTAVLSSTTAKEVAITFPETGSYSMTISQVYSEVDAATQWNGAFSGVAKGFTTIPVIIKVVE